MHQKICDQCFVEITEPRVRRYKMAFIALQYPVLHPWYYRSSPNYFSLLIPGAKLSALQVKDFAYCKQPITNFYLAKNVNNRWGAVSTEIRYLFRKYKNDNIKEASWIFTRAGNEVLQAFLFNLDIKHEATILRRSLDISVYKVGYVSAVASKILKRMRVLESFISADTEPNWMISDIVPVLPPMLRPLYHVGSSSGALSDLNAIYRNLVRINANKTVSNKTFGFSENTSLNKKETQFLFECLIGSNESGAKTKSTFNKSSLKSLSEQLEGKFGRFRYNLLGKRVDYSGRSVIIIGPMLQLNTFGLPYKMAREVFSLQLFHMVSTFLYKNSLKSKARHLTNRYIKSIISKKNRVIWRLLSILCSRNTFLLNRAPTLHKFGVQAFTPVLVSSNALHVHALVCSGFNADFDGDQMAIHLPLYKKSQAESWLMRPAQNVFAASTQSVMLKPTQDIVIGNYYATLVIPRVQGIKYKIFSNVTEPLLQYHGKKLALHDSIFVKTPLNNIVAKCLEENRFCFTTRRICQQIDGAESFAIRECFKGIHSDILYAISATGIIVLQKINDTLYKSLYRLVETTVGKLLVDYSLKYATNLPS